jgi:glycosyltransferase involved in cell wall biosynthesis
MKILMINYRYFVTGGPERYFFNIIDILKIRGHEVVEFSVKHSKNMHSNYESYFVSAIGRGDEVYFGEYNKSSIKDQVKGLSRMIYSFEVKRKLKMLIRDTRPDIAYILHYQNKMSPSVIDACKDMGVPVVHRISDFGDVCSNYVFYNYKTKGVCEKCLVNTKLNAIKYRCVYNSYLYSFVKVCGLYLQNVLRINKKIDAFVIPSNFVKEKLKQGIIDENKIHVIPTFTKFDQKLFENSAKNIFDKPFALYAGRLVEEKGLLTLIKAFESTNFQLKIAGITQNEYAQHLIKYVKDNNLINIEFLGKKIFEDLAFYYKNCLFTVVSSECYDNFPNTVIESYLFKKPVVATNIGSLAEMVVDKTTGFLFSYKNKEHLKEIIIHCFKNPDELEEMGENAYRKLNREYSENVHINKLEELFNHILINR